VADPVVESVKGGASSVGSTLGKGAEGVSSMFQGSGEENKSAASKGK
jgi:hypothetical protein